MKQDGAAGRHLNLQSKVSPLSSARLCQSEVVIPPSPAFANVGAKPPSLSCKSWRIFSILSIRIGAIPSSEKAGKSARLTFNPAPHA